MGPGRVELLLWQSDPDLLADLHFLENLRLHRLRLAYAARSWPN